MQIVSISTRTLILNFYNYYNLDTITLFNNYLGLGEVTISPSQMATVRNVGDRLEVNCTTNDSVLTWSLTYISENGMVEEHSDIIIS